MCNTMVLSTFRLAIFFLFLSILLVFSCAKDTFADLKEVQDRGVLRHLGVPYARFVTGSGDGFSTDLVKGFAKELGVHYEYVETDWEHVIPDLTGKLIKVNAGKVTITGERDIKGDLIANGLTILPWRKEILSYSTPTFPSGIWLIARADTPIKPIEPTDNIDQDIEAVKSLLNKTTVLCMSGTCLDASLYDLDKTGAIFIPVDLKMNEFAPAIIKESAQTSLLDVADALIALEKWPGQIKIIGPLSKPQEMAVGFKKTDVELLARFNKYLSEIQANGHYIALVRKYYPDIEAYFPTFFSQSISTAE